ncbi:DNA-directed RNA polymerase II subunit [Lachnellula willkommii]|uniref:DNA-directed RNA polymerase II subunit n=1 Tax=Lachnellula willkommii TaxID=215461 RepID=A0A559M509_9HELO|nr:DNA-directed RNA polymerase II subunit [Lachnellula willkommii]
MSLDLGFRYREILATKEEPALTRPQTRRILQKTTDYLEHFARFRRKENVEAVERLLTAHKELAKFERAQLGSLCCDTAEEAKTLIPSLTDKITDDDLQELLDEITKLMGYGN